MLKDKIKGLNALKKITAALQKKGKKIVFTNGCFDLLHFGHAKYLEEARLKGDILVVGVNSDASVKKIKGDKRPILQEKYRAGLVAALESVDFVVLFNEDTPSKVIELLEPDILIKGADWDLKNIVGSDFVLKKGGRVCTINLVKGLSTTNLIKRIIEKF
ncbi:MAG: D-glycero-beta-D-manno-heptose 1-phosphate adenylyltransferase [Candidatus Omnitrophica bacterium]|nr:D-glycero-beta-D-manno-heptose 1-phosphate adenylyltransferase [Candidatus Omnitrophota bacterium]